MAALVLDTTSTILILPKTSSTVDDYYVGRQIKSIRITGFLSE